MVPVDVAALPPDHYYVSAKITSPTQQIYLSLSSNSKKSPVGSSRTRYTRSGTQTRTRINYQYGEPLRNLIKQQYHSPTDMRQVVAKTKSHEDSVLQPFQHRQRIQSVTHGRHSARVSIRSPQSTYVYAANTYQHHNMSSPKAYYRGASNQVVVGSSQNNIREMTSNMHMFAGCAETPGLFAETHQTPWREKESITWRFMETSNVSPLPTSPNSNIPLLSIIEETPKTLVSSDQSYKMIGEKQQDEEHIIPNQSPETRVLNKTPSQQTEHSNDEGRGNDNRDDEEHDGILCALRDNWSSPVVLATYRPKEMQASSSSNSSQPLSPRAHKRVHQSHNAPHDDSYTVYNRLYGMKDIYAVRKQAMTAKIAAYKASHEVPEVLSFTPTINKTRRKTHRKQQQDDSDKKSVFVRLGTDAVLKSAQHSRELEKKIYCDNNSPTGEKGNLTFTPRINRYKGRGRLSTIEEQHNWLKARDKKLDKLRNKKDPEEYHTPAICQLSKKIISEFRKEEGTVHTSVGDRLWGVAAEREHKLDKVRESAVDGMFKPNVLIRKETKCLQEGTVAAALAEAELLCKDQSSGNEAFSRLYCDAEVRRVSLEEKRRTQEQVVVTDERTGEVAFRPIINASSVKMCPIGKVMNSICKPSDIMHSSRENSNQLSPNRHMGCSATYANEQENTTTEVPKITTYSAVLASQRQERDGISHLPVHERLFVNASGTNTSAHHRSRTIDAEEFSFAPKVNSVSAALDAKGRGSRPSDGGISRVEKLLESVNIRNKNIEILKEKKKLDAEAEEKQEKQMMLHIRKKRLAICPISPDLLDQTPLIERTEKWNMKRKAKIAHQRALIDEAEVAECSFAPKTAEPSSFIRSDDRQHSAQKTGVITFTF